MATATSPALTPALWKPHHNPWAVALTVTLATFMEVLDTSIANVALPHIAGSLGASQDEATWVLTSYLVSSAIVLPISGWLSNRIGRKRFYMICVALFTVCSLLCGIAQSLPVLIIARILQGAGGGGLAPSEQAILADTFPIEKRGQAFAVYGMAVVVAPAIGPTLGTRRSTSWDSASYCLEFTLDKGQEKDWFGSPLIVTFALLAAITLLVFAFWEWHHPDPIVDLKLLKNRNFGTAVFLQLVLGMVLFGSTVLIPQYLQVLLGYTAERAGMVLSPAGFVMMAMMFVAGRSLGKFDPRLMVSLGYIATALGIYNLTRLDLNTAFGTVTLWRMLQVVGLPFIFIPISTLNYVGVPANKTNQISSLSNFARNLGGSAGTALLTTFLARSSQVHQTALAANVVPGSVPYRLYMNHMTEQLMSRGMSAAAASQLAIGRTYQEMLRQASMLSYQNAFLILSVIILILTPLPFIMRLPSRNTKLDPEAMGGH